MTENPTIAEPLDSGSGPAAETPPAPGAPTAPPPYAVPVRKLYRSRTDRVFSGVCGGLGRYYDVDPVLIRILVVVATVFTGGAFALAYLVVWLVIPDEPLVPLPVGVPVTPASYAAGGTGSYVDPATGQVYGVPAYSATPRRTEPRSQLGLLTLSAALLVAALFGLANALGASITGLTIFSAVLLVIGLGLVVGAWRGRAKWLIAPALVVLLMVQGTAAVHHLVGNASGIGDRRWTPTLSEQAFELGAGNATLDLRNAPVGASSYTAKLGIGELIVVVPADTQVVLDGSIGVGEIDLPGRPNDQGSNLETSATVPALSGTAARTVDLTAEIGLGQLVVRRATS